MPATKFAISSVLAIWLQPSSLSVCRTIFSKQTLARCSPALISTTPIYLSTLSMNGAMAIRRQSHPLARTRRTRLYSCRLIVLDATRSRNLLFLPQLRVSARSRILLALLSPRTIRRPTDVASATKDIEILVRPKIITSTNPPNRLCTLLRVSAAIGNLYSPTLITTQLLQALTLRP